MKLSPILCVEQEGDRTGRLANVSRLTRVRGDIYSAGSSITIHSSYYETDTVFV